MRATTTVGLLALCLITLTGCTDSMDHQAAWQTALGGTVGGLAFLGLAKLFRGPDGGGSTVGTVGSVATGGVMFLMALSGVVSLVSPEPKPATGAYACSVTADKHEVVTIQNVGTLTLVVGSVNVQLQDAAGKPQGTSVMAFLPTTLKLPHTLEAGEKQTFDLGNLATGGRPQPARCTVTGSQRTSGNAPGSVLSGW